MIHYILFGIVLLFLLSLPFILFFLWKQDKKFEWKDIPVSIQSYIKKHLFWILYIVLYILLNWIF